MNIYLIEIGQISQIDNQFHFYNKVVFTSKRSMENYVNSVLEVDKATDVVIDDCCVTFHTGEKKRKMVDFTTMSVEMDDQPSKPIRVRFVISQMKPMSDVGSRNGFRLEGLSM